MLCLRPSKNQGLPLSTLDGVFSQFKLSLQDTLPSNVEASIALRAAWKLCDEMGNTFPNEHARGAAFEDCVGPMFHKHRWHHQFVVEAATEVHSGKVDSCFMADGIVYILREDKVDLGVGNDAYMQVCRDYQIYVESLSAEDRARGAPKFLLLVIGE